MSPFFSRSSMLALLSVASLAPALGCRHRAPLPRPPTSLPSAVAVAPPTPVAPAVPTDSGRRIKRVVIISEDGLRPDALMRVLPPVHAAIMKRAAFSLQARTIRRASTLPSHAAMLSGFDVKQHGLYWNSWKPERGYILVPTIFDAAEKSGMGAAAFVGKQKLEHIAHPGSVDVFSRSGYFCKKVVEEAAEYLVAKRPQIEFIHFSDPDDLGHSDGWMSNPQLEAVRHTDRCLHTLLDAVSAAGLDRDTLFIISADHGGHGHNHSGKIKEDRLIPWIAWGPGVRAGHRITSPISTVDTAATTLWVLGYPPTPGAIGHPVFEAFDAATIAASGPKTKTIPF
ncbi:MAG TPA: alkaline phosphatase [Polyangia bacterium]|nr:alkaline phosphatase [Polyangia bacterium]